MSAIVLVLLALAWVAVMLPSILKHRRQTPYSSTSRFRRSLEVIAPPSFPSSPSQSLPSARARRARQVRNRQLVTALLLTAVIATLALAAPWGGSWWYLNYACDLALVAGLGTFAGQERKRREKLAKVRRLNSRARRARQVRRSGPEPIYFHEPVRSMSRRG